MPIPSPERKTSILPVSGWKFLAGSSVVTRHWIANPWGTIFSCVISSSGNVMPSAIRIWDCTRSILKTRQMTINERLRRKSKVRNRFIEIRFITRWSPRLSCARLVTEHWLRWSRSYQIHRPETPRYRHSNNQHVSPAWQRNRSSFGGSWAIKTELARSRRPAMFNEEVRFKIIAFTQSKYKSQHPF